MNARKPDLSRKTSKESVKSDNPDVFNLTVVLKYEGCEDQVNKLAIHKTRGGDDVWKQVISWLEKEFKYEASPERKLRIIFGDKDIPDTETPLSELGLVNNS